MEISFDKLDTNLKSLINAQKSRITTIKSLSSINTNNSGRSVYKLIFEDHTILKGRTFSLRGHAQKIYSLSSYIKDLNISKPISFSENSMLMEWIDGFSPSPGELNINQIEACGKMMGQIHSRSIPQSALDKFKSYGLKDKGNNHELNKYILSQLDKLYESGLLTRSESNKFAHLIMSFKIAETELTLVCGDLCAENLVINERGLFFVDTENLTIDTTAYDIARTLYRWPMKKNEKAAFIKGYRLVSGKSNYNNNFKYWVIRVLVNSAIFRSKISNAPDSFRLLPIKNLKMIIDSGSNINPGFVDSELIYN